MAKVLVLYYSDYGHIETMAYAVRKAPNRQVPTSSSSAFPNWCRKTLPRRRPIATVDELLEYDAIIFGDGTRYGTVASRMRNFIDQTGALWAQGKLVGKVGSVLTSSATQHGGQETTILGFIPTLMRHGMIVVGLPYAFQGEMGLEEIKGGSPYGA
ncbi:MAG: NAD(P)H:quinone oxidoreductase, partial [Ensifer adhaerens]